MIVFLYQREINPPSCYEAARCVTRLSDKGWSDSVLKYIKTGFRHYVVTFKQPPPDKLILKACEDAVLRGIAVELPKAEK